MFDAVRSDLSRTGSDSLWHAGERDLQARVGASETMELIGRRVISDHLIDQHRAFYPRLPWIVAGAVDPAGEVWATVIAGVPGFLQSPDPRTLNVVATRVFEDPADAGLGDGDAIGLLGIELRTRRRNRLNGLIRRADAAGFTVTVGESFGNCPRYISPRAFSFVRDPAEPTLGKAERLAELDDRARAFIASADTLFIASYVDNADGVRKVDVSHRGGPAGFVRVAGDGELVVPDYPGNNFFNTLGNIRANPKAGLVFVDFASGDVLQITGEAEVALDDPAVATFAGAQLLLRIQPRRIVRRRDALPLRWTALNVAPSHRVATTGA